MMKPRYPFKTLLMAALLLAAALPSHALGAKAPGGAKYAEDEVIVRFKDGVTSSQKDSAASGIKAKRIRDFDKLRMRHLRLPEGLGVMDAVEMLNAMPGVEFAEPNYVLSIKATPDDPYFYYQWGLYNYGQGVNGSAGIADADIDAPEAWDTSTGSADVVVAVLDTGVDYNHPDISPNIWTNPGEVAGNGLDDDGNGYADDVHGWDFFGSDSDPMDDEGHGTHVAGTIAAAGNDGTGITGVAWTARIMALKFLDLNGVGYASDAISAIQYASAMGADIINCSFGGYSYSASLKAAIDASSALFVCAAGNEGNDNDALGQYPSSYSSENVLAVAASDQSDNIVWYSNYGATTVDISAPGSNILSSIVLRATVWQDDFGDGDISDWSTDGGGTWLVEGGALSDGAGNYANNAEVWASKGISLTGQAGCTLYYTLTLDTETNYDFLYVESSPDNLNWTILDYHTGALAMDNYELSLPYSGSGTLYIRFRLVSDSTITRDGAYINDVAAICASTAYNGYSEYAYSSGTSMAAPHASGTAALIKAWAPWLSAADIKYFIMYSADIKPAMSGLLASGGRLNASNALIYPPSILTAQALSKSSIYLTWADNSSNEQGFIIERKTSGTEYAEAARVGAGSVTYTDNGLSSGTTYTYRVRAYTVLGVSSYSNEAAAKTEGTRGEGSGGGGGCFIATAAYGNYDAPDVMTLRIFRDRVLMKTAPGRAFVRLYYRYSPPLADYISRHEGLRPVARLALAPVVFGVRHPAGGAALFAFTLGAAIAGYNLKRKRKNRDDS